MSAKADSKLTKQSKTFLVSLKIQPTLNILVLGFMKDALFDSLK